MPRFIPSLQVPTNPVQALTPPPPTGPKTVSFTAGGEHPTLQALLLRQKQAMAADPQLPGVGEMVSPWQGASYLANKVSSALQQRQAEQQYGEGQQAFSSALSQIDPVKGATAEQAQAIGEWSPETLIDLWKMRAEQQAKAASVDSYGPVISGEQAKALGLDAAKSYQLNQKTGQYDQIGGGGITVNSGSDKLTDWLAKDTVFYPGARNAAFDLEDGLDAALTNAQDALAEQSPVGSGYLMSDAYKNARISGDSWIQNVLRKESGATIPEPEMESYRKTYLPQPGDGPQQIEAKRLLRRERTDSMRHGLENGAPNTLAGIDTAYEARVAARKAKKDKTAAPDPNAPADTPPPAATGGGGGAPVVIAPSDTAGYDALPEGTQYKLPGDDTLYIKKQKAKTGGTGG